MQNLRSILLTGLCLFYGATTSASAAYTVFNITYSGASFGNSAVATGQVTLDTALLNNPGITMFYPISLGATGVSGLSLTVSGASVGNGTFGLTDYEELSFSTGGVTLDFNSELVGQGGGWGDTDGDFSLFPNSVGMTAGAPFGTGPRTLTTGGMMAMMNDNGDKMRLTSFAPAAVPEPSRALLGALGFLGLVLRRRRSC
jgi:MYXO-CTERM domain-containing protein